MIMGLTPGNWMLVLLWLFEGGQHDVSGNTI